MAKPYPWTPKTLERAHAAAEFVDRAHWLSTSGRQVLKVIDILGSTSMAGQRATAAQVVDQIAAYGQEFSWDMGNMTTPQERSFMVWMVTTRLAGGK